MEKQFNKVEGLKGEIDACEYLENKKYKIIEKNYRNYIGEIDIVAQQKNVIVFVEVKLRSTFRFGRPSEAVDFRKQQKLRSVANLYLIQHKMTDKQCRFDIIEIVGQYINHIENAF